MNQNTRKPCQHAFSRYNGKPYIHYFGVHVDRKAVADPLVTPKKCGCIDSNCQHQNRSIVLSNGSCANFGKMQGYYN